MPPTQVTNTLLTGSSVLWVCLMVGIIGALVLLGIVAFGIYLYSGRLRRSFVREEEWFRLIDRAFHGAPPPVLRPLIEAYSDELQRRNEFWTSYGQTIVAVLIIIVLTILLLTRSISAEAGLPILSGISGFAIAKSVSSSRSLPPNQGPQG